MSDSKWKDCPKLVRVVYLRQEVPGADDMELRVFQIQLGTRVITGYVRAIVEEKAAIAVARQKLLTFINEFAEHIIGVHVLPWRAIADVLDENQSNPTKTTEALIVK